MAKINWKDIKKQYVSEVEETGVDLHTFCVRNGINYSTARKYLNNKLLKDNGVTTEQIRRNAAKPVPPEQKNKKKDPRGRKPKKKPTPQPTDSAQTEHGPEQSNPEAEPKPKQRGGKREGAGAPKGNQNSYVHGLFREAFGDLVKYSHQVDDEFKLQVHKLASLHALNEYTRYKEEFEQLKEEIAAQLSEQKPPTEQQMEAYAGLEKRMKSSLNQCTYHTGKLEYMENQRANRAYTKAATIKTKAQTRQVIIDRKLKEKGIGLADAKTKQAKAQTALAEHELTAKEKEGLGDKDDLGMTLDEVMEMDNDEIIQRFKDNGGELHIDD